jgi:hypothetical protein
MSAPKQGGADISGQINWIVDRLKGFKIADPLITTQLALANPEGYPIAKGAGLAVTGKILEMVGEAVGVNAVERMGKIAVTGGASTAVNALVASYIYEAKNNPAPTGSGITATGESGYPLGARPTGENASVGLTPRVGTSMYDDPTYLRR